MLQSQRTTATTLALLAAFLLLPFSVLSARIGATPRPEECDSQLYCSGHGLCLKDLTINDQWRCECNNGWTGPNCSVNSDECADSACKNNATCEDLANRRYKCICPVGFIGRFCEFVDRCHLENPCHPSATCTTSIVDGRLTCFCAAGFTGQTCSIRIRKNICEKRPCYKNGTCRLDNSNEDGFVCDCVPGYRGKLCDEAVIENPCDGNPCANSGTCQPDGFGKFVCSCPPGYWGTRCELKAEPAALCPCRNGGHCLTVDGGTACSCPLGFNGPNCENNIGSCSAAASAAPDGVVCHNGGDCLDKVGGGFRCRCPAGWFGDRCASRANPCQSRPCANSALCRPAPNWVNFSCDCSTADGGFSGPLCLDDIDECQAAGRCDSDGTQRCLNTVGSFKCVCKPGFVGEHCDRRADRCASVVCLNGGWCDPADGSCRCQPEFDGFDCFRPRDNCFPSPCLNGGQCRTLVDAYVCTCPPSYGGLDCEKVNACSNSSCLGRGTCRVEQRIAASAAAAAGQPDFRCDCHSGFGGQFCQDRIRGGAVLSRGSGCSDSLCSGVGRCFNDSGTILCQCPFGYSGRRCESPVNPCDSNPCRRGGTCVAGLANGDPTNYTCLCKPGFQGPHCEANINECANGGACDPRGTEVCIDGVASFTCRCLPGFTGQLCNRSIDYCLPTATPKPPRCLNGGVCRSDRRQPTPGAVCDCPAGYHGPLCQLTFDPCAAASAVCQNGGVCEIVGANRTRCICPPGTAGLRCEIDYINSCKSSASPTGESPCHGDQSECRDLPEGFRCRCQPGLCGPTCDRECPTLEEERSSCRMHGCQTKAGNGVCDPDCDSLACDWDGGDCASGWRPWANCTAARSGDAGGCIAGYGDGLCQPECSDQRCLFDGGDCDAPTSAPSDHEYESYCRDHFADGRCDSGCDTAAYLFDGGDCMPASSTGKLPPQPPTPPPPAGYLKLAVGGRNASGFRPDTAVGRQFVRSLSQRLGCLVQLAAEPSAAVSSGDGAVVLVLVYRLGLCHRPDRCYTSADYAAQALAADLRLESSASSTAAGRRRPRPSLTLPLIGVSAQLPAAAPDPLVSRDSMLLPAVVGCVCLSIIAIFIGVLFRTFKSSASSASRSSSIGGGTGRREAGRLWCPPGFQPLNSVSSSGGGCGCGHPDNECPGAAYSMQHRQHPLLLDDSFEQPAAKRSKRCCSTDRTKPQTVSMLTSLTDGDSPGCVAATSSQPAPSDTPIHTVISAGTCVEGPPSDKTVEMIRQLLDNGYSAEAQSEPWGETPLHLAARYCRVDAVQTLLEFGGVDPNRRDRFGRTPLHLAIASGANGVCHLLMRDRRTDLNAKAHDGTTPLMVSASYLVKDVEVAAALTADPQVDINAVDCRGRTALHWAASVNSDAMVALLLRRGANRDAQDGAERTPLFLAALEGSAAAAALLLSAGANPLLADATQKTPRQMAQERLHRDIEAMLASVEASSSATATSAVDTAKAILGDLERYPTPPDGSADSPQHCLQKQQQKKQHQPRQQQFAQCSYSSPNYLTPSPDSAPASSRSGAGGNSPHPHQLTSSCSSMPLPPPPPQFSNSSEPSLLVLDSIKADLV